MPSLAETQLAFFQASADYPETTLQEAEKSYWGPLQSTFQPWTQFALADVKRAALQAITGLSNYSLTDLELAWLGQQSGVPVGSIFDGWLTASQVAQAQNVLKQAVVWLDPQRESQSLTKQTLTNWGSLGATGNAQFGSVATADTNDPIWLPWTGQSYLYVPDGTNNYITTVPTWVPLWGFQIKAQVELSNWQAASQACAIVFAPSTPGPGRTVEFNLFNGTLYASCSGVLTSVSTASFPNNTPIWLRMSWYANTALEIDYSTNGINWTNIARTTHAIGVPSAPDFWLIGNNTSWNQGFKGKLYKVEIIDHLGNTITAFDANLSGQTGYADKYGRNWAFSRTTTSYTTTLVDRPMCLLCTDDWLQIPDNAALDFGANQPFTVLGACRIHENAPPGATTLVSKRLNVTGGYDLTWWSPTSIRILLQSTDGTASPATSVNTVPIHELGVYTGVRNVNNVTIINYANGNPGTPAADTTIAKDLSTTSSLHIGTGVGGQVYWANMEFYGMALWNRVLTQEEIQAVSTYFKSKPSTQEAVVSEALLLLDARNYPGSGVMPNYGTLGTAGDAQLGSAGGADTNDPIFIPFTGEKYYYIPKSDLLNDIGIAHKDSLVPPINSLFQIEVDLAPDTWQFVGTDRTVIGKWQALNGYRGYRLDQKQDGSLQFYWSEDGTANVNTITPIVSTTPGDRKQFRITVNCQNGSILFETSSNKGQTWFNFHSAAFPVTFCRNAPTTLRLGNYEAGGFSFQGRLYNASFKINNQIVADFQSANSGQAGYTDFYGNNWTIARLSSGLKSVLVERPTFLLGTDDYLSVANNVALNFAAADSFTALISARVFGTAGSRVQLLSKYTAGNIGYQINWTGSNIKADILDGVSGVSLIDPITTEQLAVYIAQKIGTSLNKFVTPISTKTGTAPVGTLANALNLYIGRAASFAGEYPSMEFFGAAVWNRALTDAEIQQATSYFLTK